MKRVLHLLRKVWICNIVNSAIGKYLSLLFSLSILSLFPVLQSNVSETNEAIEFLSDSSESNDEFSPGEIDPPPIPSPLPTYENSIHGHEFEIMKNFYIAYAQDRIEFRRQYFQRHREYIINCPLEFAQSLGRNSKIFIWLYRYFYSDQILQMITEEGFTHTYYMCLMMIERRIFRMQNNLYLNDDLPIDWQRHTWYSRWYNSGTNISLLAAATAMVKPPGLRWRHDAV